MTLAVEPAGLRVTTPAKRSAYAARYPLLKAREAGEFVFEARHRLGSGEFVFGALSGDESRWLATSQAMAAPDGNRKTVTLKLAAGEKFMLMLANSHPTDDIASDFVIESLAIVRGDGEEISFGSREDESRHHRVFSEFPCPDISVPAGFCAYFSGTLLRESLFPGGGHSPARTVSTSYPAFNDEYLEWVALASAVCAAEGEFTMMELGAGYGRWLLMGAGLARRKKIPFKLIGVEAEPSHFHRMETCFRENSLDPAEHSLIEAAVTGTGEDVWFHASQADDWYGQRIALASEKSPTDRAVDLRTGKPLRRVQSLTLDSLLRPLASVDLIDLDIQGAEADVLASATEQLDAKVKMVTVGTHVHPVTYTYEIERAVHDVFTKMNWKKVYHFLPGGERETPFGRITFEDGVQVWVNPKATRTLNIIRHS